MLETQVKTGTTTVGIVCNDCVILAADTRGTVGNIIRDTDVDKVHQVAPGIGLTISGSVSSIQLIIKNLKAQIRLHELRVNRNMTVKEAGNMLAGWLYGMGRTGNIAHFLVGGVDENGPKLYDAFPDGSLLTAKKYLTSGSGMMFAEGVLESHYSVGMSKQEGIELAEKAINTAIQKDNASGNGLRVYSISKEGVTHELSKKVNTQLQ